MGVQACRLHASSCSQQAPQGHWCVALGCLLAAGWSMANGRLGPPWRVVRVHPARHPKATHQWLLWASKGFKGLRAGKRQAWTPIRSHWCVALGCRVGCRMKHGKRQAWTPMTGCTWFLMALRAGKRQAWTPIRSHWCVALGCLLAAGWSMANGRLGPPWPFASP